MKINITLLLYILLGIPAFVNSQPIVNTKHNLSVSGPGSVKSTIETEVCVFCHTPHNSNPQIPLWNRNNSSAIYTIYDNSISNTFNANTGQPDGSSLLCLSCHDGTVALGNVLSSSSDIFDGAGTKMPAGSRGHLGIDLSDDHPISFVFDAALATSDGQLKYPPVYPATLDVNSKVQCSSCHNAHNNMYGKFLVASNEYSDLCKKCHDMQYWNNSSHSTSPATWNGSGTNPWAHIETPFPTVSQNACENCHQPHSAGGKVRLLKSSLEENNCLDCHNGNVAQSSKDIATELAKPYKHDVAGYNLIHNPNETTSFASHVECEDCHNPHAANSASASAPYASGKLAGVGGVNQNGSWVKPISNEYELCYKCHADNALSVSSTTRQIEQNNTRLEFDLDNPSYHPVVGAGKNPNSPSLIPPYSESSIIYCTDCHASNDSNSPAGPHGSIYPRILKYRYEKADYTQESSSTYELCYSCHSRTSILSNVSFKKHSKHIVNAKAPCNACHDPHGISYSQGNSTNNSHLINFDLDIVKPLMGQLIYEDLGNGRGRCYLTCHGKRHRRYGY